MKFLITAFLAFTLTCAIASAKITQSTNYNYFAVRGNSALEVYLSLLAHAKGFGGHNAYATTVTTISQKTDFNSGKMCKFKNYQINAWFKITLPKLVSNSGLSKSDASNWASFANVLKVHELHHRQIWLGCASRFNSEAMNMREQNCATLTQNYKAMWKKINENCRNANDAFDLSERTTFLKQPLIRSILKPIK